MTLNLAADAYVLESTEGEALWFADALITYKTTGKETNGGLTVAEVPTTWRDRTAGTSRFQLWRWLPRYLKWYRAGIAGRFRKSS